MSSLAIDKYNGVMTSWNKRQIYNIRRTKSQILNVSGLVLQSSSCNILKPGVKSRMKI